MKLNLSIKSFLVLFLLSCFWGQFSFSMDKLPTIRTIGILPVLDLPSSVEVEENELYGILSSSFEKSQRFRIIDSSLVESIYFEKNEEKKIEQIKQFEIDAFILLKVFTKSDDLIVELRLLSSNFDVLMFEQDSYKINTFNSFNKEDLSNKIENLVFRFINRLPYDSIITSVQGDYLTIDIGKNQNLEVNDPVIFLKSYIQDLHPATKTWLNFKTITIGSGKIIEVKDKVSIVKILELKGNEKLEVGDPIKINNSISRLKFKPKSEPSTYQNIGTIVSYPTTTNDNATTSNIDQEAQVPNPNNQSKVVEENKNTTDNSTNKGKEENTESKDQISNEETSSSESSTQDNQEPKQEEEGYPLKELFHSLFNLATLELSVNAWQVNDVSAKVPSGFLVNNFLIHTGKYLEDSVGYDLDLDFGFGPTKKGNYFGINLDGNVFWNKAINDIDFISNVKLGIGAKNENLSVSDETFGGWNTFYFRLLVGTEDTVEVFSDETMNWSVNIYMVPAVLGTLGYNEKKESIQSAFGLFLESQFILLGDTDKFEYGLGWRMGVMNLKTNKDSFKYTQFRLSFCARRTF